MIEYAFIHDSTPGSTLATMSAMLALFADRRPDAARVQRGALRRPRERLNRTAMHAWPAIGYRDWAATCDTLHAHSQVLGKLAAVLAPPEPQLLHAALRLTARGLETAPLPAPDGSGAFAVALDLHRHEAIVEHTGGGLRRIALMPDRPVGAVTRDVLEAVRSLAGAGRDRPDAAGGGVDRATGRGRSACPLRRREGCRLPRRRHACRPRSHDLPSALPGSFHGGQRVVGIVRHRREPLLGRSPPTRRRTTSSCATR